MLSRASAQTWDPEIAMHVMRQRTDCWSWAGIHYRPNAGSRRGQNGGYRTYIWGLILVDLFGQVRIPLISSVASVFAYNDANGSASFLSPLESEALCGGVVSASPEVLTSKGTAKVVNSPPLTWESGCSGSQSFVLVPS